MLRVTLIYPFYVFTSALLPLSLLCLTHSRRITYHPYPPVETHLSLLGIAAAMTTAAVPLCSAAPFVLSLSSAIPPCVSTELVLS